MRAAGELRHRKRADALAHAIERLPVESRRAMLEGLGAGPIIAGAYSAGRGVCPALGAYRRGARTSYSDFAQAWDRYARGRGVRKAGRDDLATLVAMLRASLPGPAYHANGNGHVNGNGYMNGNGRVNGNGRPASTRSTPPKSEARAAVRAGTD